MLLYVVILTCSLLGTVFTLAQILHLDEDLENWK